MKIIGEYSARLVINGKHEPAGSKEVRSTYSDFWSPVSSLALFRALIHVSMGLGLVVAIGDAVAAYLQSILKGYPIYIIPPKEVSGGDDLPRELWKPLYGLRLSSFCWWDYFSDLVRSMRWKRSSLIGALFYKGIPNISSNDSTIWSIYSVCDNVTTPPSFNSINIPRYRLD